MAEEHETTRGNVQERPADAPVAPKVAARIPAPAPRIDYRAVAPGAVAAMRHMEAYVRDCDLEPSLLELVRLRASQPPRARRSECRVAGSEGGRAGAVRRPRGARHPEPRLGDAARA